MFVSKLHWDKNFDPMKPSPQLHPSGSFWPSKFTYLYRFLSFFTPSHNT